MDRTPSTSHFQQQPLLLVKVQRRPQFMNTPETTISADAAQHQGPHLGILAIVFTALFNAGLLAVTVFTGPTHFPGPGESADAIAEFFQTHPSSVLACSFLQFGSAIPLGIFTATIVSRLRFLGVRAAGPNIALFGGLMTAFNMAAAALVLWVMAYPGIAQDAPVLRALYYLSFALGGPGYSVPLGLLMAGVCVPALFLKLLPKWIVILGLILAVFGELSYFDLITSKALPLIPLTRFPGFVWLIAAGFALPKSLAGRRSGL
ncbi:MAG TPA: hypothetical protein VKC60_08225 [Opitutaceae bacterium]|nr:hypothetical protein [Opitutaceae bacterium]